MECRKAVVKELEDEGYLVKVEPYTHNVGTCYRHHDTVVEPYAVRSVVRFHEALGRSPPLKWPGTANCSSCRIASVKRT